MIKLTIGDLPLIAPLLQAATDEAGTAARSNVDFSLTQLHVNMEKGMGDVFVDSIDKPTAILILGGGQSPTYTEKFCAIALMFVLKEHRSPAKTEEMLELARKYAKGRGSDVLYWSRWDYNGAKQPDAMWTKHGFKKQETLFIQHLT